MLKVRYDRTENAVSYDGTVEELVDGDLLSIRLDAETPRCITVHMKDNRDTSLLWQEEVLDSEPSKTQREELNRWLRSVASYLALQDKNTPWSKLWKLFMDKLWLKMSPSGRRIVLLVVIAEASSLIFFILFLIVYYAVS